MNLRRVALLKMVTQAQEIEAGTLRGHLTRDEHGHWLVEGVALDAWLSAYEKHEVVFIAGRLDDERPAVMRTCNRCGRDYTEAECPHCADVRHRLRPRR